MHDHLPHASSTTRSPHLLTPAYFQFGRIPVSDFSSMSDHSTLRTDPKAKEGVRRVSWGSDLSHNSADSTVPLLTEQGTPNFGATGASVTDRDTTDTNTSSTSTGSKRSSRFISKLRSSFTKKIKGSSKVASSNVPVEKKQWTDPTEYPAEIRSWSAGLWANCEDRSVKEKEWEELCQRLERTDSGDFDGLLVVLSELWRGVGGGDPDYIWRKSITFLDMFEHCDHCKLGSQDPRTI